MCVCAVHFIYYLNLKTYTNGRLQHLECLKKLKLTGTRKKLVGK
jgi:hypothetical protein